MKKKWLLKCVMALSLLLTNYAYAGAFDASRGYFGGEISLYNRTQYNGGSSGDLNRFKANDTDTTLAIRKNKPGINVLAGIRFTENWGMEVGFGFIDKVKAEVQNGNMATNKISNIYIDGLGFLPVCPTIDLIGGVGAGILKSKPDVTDVIFTNKALLEKEKIGYRIGGGAQCSMSENWAVRAMIRYQSGSKEFLKGLTSISIGATYTFI